MLIKKTVLFKVIIQDIAMISMLPDLRLALTSNIAYAFMESMYGIVFGKN